MVDEKLLELRGVSKRFGATLALNNVDFDLRPGEVHGLVGENGAGRVHLMKILSGYHTDYEGK
jgi:ribose transport system ATP-binding protein